MKLQLTCKHTIIFLTPACLLLTFGCSPRSHSSGILSDTNLIQAIRQELGKPQGDITASDLEKITTLRAEKLGIFSIDGLQSCRNLTRLLLSGNQIRGITPLAGLSNLRSLRLYDNQIRDITPLVGLTEMTSLALGNNQISDIGALVPLVNLTNLDLDNNQITDISALSNLSNLRFLYLYQNRITDIGPLENLASLSIVSLRDNRISDISALVRNVGIGAGDDVSIDRNPLSDIARNTQIPALEQRGVRVVY